MTHETKTTCQTQNVQHPEQPISIDTLPVRQPPPVDWERAYAQQEVERAKQLKVVRGQLRTELLELGITTLCATYDGYGDEGNVGDINSVPDAVVIAPALAEKLEDFIWSMAYGQSPGFEINEGGDGELEWMLEADTINIDHCTNYVERDHARFEDV